jgi:hypothetical protein
MEKTYWLGRKRAALVMARGATSSEARLIHYDLAGRYSIKAAFAPFMLPLKDPATDGEREALRPLRPFGMPAPAIVRRPPPSPRRRKPGRKG